MSRRKPKGAATPETTVNPNERTETSGTQAELDEETTETEGEGEQGDDESDGEAGDEHGPITERAKPGSQPPPPKPPSTPPPPPVQPASVVPRKRRDLSGTYRCLNRLGSHLPGAIVELTDREARMYTAANAVVPHED